MSKLTKQQVKDALDSGEKVTDSVLLRLAASKWTLAIVIVVAAGILWAVLR